MAVTIKNYWIIYARTAMKLNVHELNGDEYKEPKKHNRNLSIDYNMEMTIDYQK